MSIAPLNEAEQLIVANVQEFGCHVVTVFDPDEIEPNFAYSVGFWETVEQPEVIILGLPLEMGHFAVNEMFRQCKNGLKLFDGQHIKGLFEEFDVICVARSVEARHLVPQFFNSAIWYHFMRVNEPLKSALQLVWSYEGLYPWDEEVPPELLEDQPLLYSESLH